MNTLSSLLNFIGNYIGTVESVTPSMQVAGHNAIKKVGKVVSIEIVNVNNLPNASARNDFATLPPSWRPARNIGLTFGDPQWQRTFRLSVETGGIVSIYNYQSAAITSSTNATTVLTYIAGG